MQWLLLIFLAPYLYLFLKIGINLLGIRNYSVSDRASIFVSVVVACRNEEKNLQSVMKDISAQDYPQELFEVIIIDDNSSDLTFSIATEFREIKNLIVNKNNGSGKKQAVRTGVSLSSGNLIITTDADCNPGESWISTIASFYEKNHPELIIGPVALKGDRGFFQKFQELEFLGLQGITAGCAIDGNPVMCNGANLAFAKNSYRQHSSNLHDELKSGDDIFLLQSIKKVSPYKISWLESEKALVTTRVSETFGSFINQRVRWISKAGSYTDNYTIIIAMATLIAILLQVSALIAGIFNPVFLPVFLAVYLLKSLPDLMILRNTSDRYNKKNLMGWFPLSQFVYPFYVIAVLLSFLFRSKEENLNSPYRTGT